MPSRTAWGKARRVAAGAIVLAFGAVALAAPMVAGKSTAFVLGLLLLAAAVPEIAHAFIVRGRRAGNAAFFGSFMTLASGVLLIAEPQLALGAMAILLGGSFVVDGSGKLAAWYGGRREPGQENLLIDGLISVLLGLFIGAQWPISGSWAVAVSVGLRLLASGWSMLIGRDDASAAPPTEIIGAHPDARLRLPPHAELAKLRADLICDDDARRKVDRYWVFTFLLTFFAIHVGRMDIQGNPIGLLSPVVAVLGDALLALLLSWGLITPARLAWRMLSRPVERTLWTRQLNAIDHGRGRGIVSRVLQYWLAARLHFALRLQQARRSPTAAVRQGLHNGLPLAAIFIALNPIWGFSWYFNSENWVTGVWERWTEYSVDRWRGHMVRTAQADQPNIAPAAFFKISPDGTDGNFSFIVIGDTGEGDASQHILRDQIILAGQRPEVKFLVLSSDVIYPAGAMKDYEPKFYLPFKGFSKPIYAIPGNHDWYDALEAFTANFLERTAARSALRGRREADYGLTSTTESRIEAMIRDAGRLREAYGIRNGLQRAPYFELQTDRFALIAVDTGILKHIDDEQFEWLRAALKRARGKFIMVIPGHPLYAGGRYKCADNDSFVKMHDLLREYKVAIVMAGDTHYLEYYQEMYDHSGAARPMHHFVNGGGGAYLSIGTPLDWPREPAAADAAYYPRRQDIVDKLDTQTPLWKMPIWIWVKRLNAWPTSAETMASAFDFNRAPFFQSFVEVKVDVSARSVSICPFGIRGRLRWRDLEAFGGAIPAGQDRNAPVEFRVPFPLATD